MAPRFNETVTEDLADLGRTLRPGTHLVLLAELVVARRAVLQDNQARPVVGGFRLGVRHGGYEAEIVQEAVRYLDGSAAFERGSTHWLERVDGPAAPISLM